MNSIGDLKSIRLATRTGAHRESKGFVRRLEGFAGRSPHTQEEGKTRSKIWMSFEVVAPVPETCDDFLTDFLLCSRMETLIRDLLCKGCLAESPTGERHISMSASLVVNQISGKRSDQQISFQGGLHNAAEI